MAMNEGIIESRKRFAIFMALALQVVLFLWSSDHTQISMFCTVSKSLQWSWIGYVHVGYLGLFLLGLASLMIPRARLPYVALLGLTLMVLPLQVQLLNRGLLFCDGP